MNALRKVSFWLIAGLLASGFAARAFGHEAKIVRVTGTATVLMPDGTSTPAVKGVMVPEGATITTSAGSQVFLEVFSGGLATIAENTTVGVEKLALEKSGDTVTSQEAMLDLKKGSVISALDPAKKAINHYGVRTPKGVAAARGTVYTVTVGDDQYTMEVTSDGAVVFTPLDASGQPNPGQAVTITAGGAVTVETGGSVQTLNAAEAATNPAVRTALSVAQAALQTIANNPDDFGAENASHASDALTTVQNTTASVNEALQSAQQTPITPVDVGQVSASHN